MQSMTGFGRSEQVIDGFCFSIEIKSVNHRYLDIRFRLPPGFQMHESALSEDVRSKVQRGSIDISMRQKLVSVPRAIHGGTRFQVDERAAKSLLDAVETLHRKFQLPLTPSLEFIESTGKVILAIDEEQDQSHLLPGLRSLLNRALDLLLEERAREGAATAKALANILQSLTDQSTQLTKYGPLQPEKIRERLNKRLQQWSLAAPVDPQRLDLEVAFLADRADISEEIQRLETHVEQFSKLLEASTPVGRKLDFLTQEIHREVNTIASKADDITLSRCAVEAKTAIEKLREQVQNVE